MIDADGRSRGLAARIDKREPASWQVQVFFDGDCPLCVREITMLSKLDRKRRIFFTDIAAPEFDATVWGSTYAQLMASIRGRLPDGQWIDGVEVFRRLYGAVGFAPLVWISRLAGIRHLLDLGYTHFAKNRLRWTGRCTSEAGCAIPEHRLEP